MGIYLPTLKQTNLKSTENEMNCELMLTYNLGIRHEIQCSDWLFSVQVQICTQSLRL
jgi:hypothetical protein